MSGKLVLNVFRELTTHETGQQIAKLQTKRQHYTAQQHYGVRHSKSQGSC